MKIKDCLPIALGLWYHINYDFPDIFDIDPSQLDIIFLSNWSMRTAAPILNVLHSDPSSSMLTDEELTTLAGIINGMFRHKWDKMMDVAEMEYDPIHNYYDQLTESIEYSEEIDRDSTLTGSKSNTRTDNLNETITDGRTIQESRNLVNNGSNSNQDNIYGFNSVNAVGEGNSSGTNANTETGTVTTVHSGNMTTANTGTQTNAGSVSNTEVVNDDKSGGRTRDYTKIGNIGNISTQKLLNEELDLWRYNFISEMMRDVANFITIPLYEH